MQWLRAEIMSCIVVAVVQLLNHVRLFATCGLQHARLPCPSVSLSLLSFIVLWMQVEFLPLRGIFSGSELLCKGVVNKMHSNGIQTY